MNKYFTPNIEDIHVGYECEHKNDIYWVHWIIEDPEFIRNLAFSTRKLNDIKYEYDLSNKIRTPYLTNKQIAAEGWTFHSQSINNQFFFKKENIMLGVLFGRVTKNNEDEPKEIRTLVIWKESPTFNAAVTDKTYIFQGVCPSINEFRKITKLVNI